MFVFGVVIATDWWMRDLTPCPFPCRGEIGFTAAWSVTTL
jgi:hypothetical protein